ncbi:hypothetical protein SASPL_148849 [Salvia splendens]|uniref:Uncharacterized protein n=1 Tax=Salvia splendens TaxID=180675 RepID=A0A8X8WAM4_SALSN|nr:hypothetical protein SASPL_148849 [Salvia splendens]
MFCRNGLSLNKANEILIRKRARAKDSLKNANLETSGSEKADTSHVQETVNVIDSPDMSKGSKRRKESVMNTNDQAVDKNDKVQTEGIPKKAPVTKKLKASPWKIIELIQALNEKQMSEVVDMGFGELRHFGIAEVPDTLLINPCGDGKCRTHIDYVFRDILVVKEYNWCAYVLETLSVAVKNLRSTKNTPFTGPIAFLVAFYVDRVFHKKLLVSRVFPTVFGWTSEKLRQREKMELESTDTIGRGSLVDRGDPDKLPRPSGILVFEEEETEEKDHITDFKNVIKNFEAMKIAGSTACNMMGVISEVEVDEEDTVASLKTALAKDKFNTPELVDAVQSMLKVTAHLTKLAAEGPPFDIHPSFVPKNGDLARRIGVKQGKRSNKNELQNCDITPQAGVNKDKKLDVQAIVQSAVEAYMECDEVDKDFVTPFANKSEPKLGKELVVYTNEQLHDNHKKLMMNVRPKADLRCSNALRSPFLERAIKVSCKLTPDERVMYYWLMTTYHGNEEHIIYNDRFVEVMLLEFCSLLPHHEVSSGIISAFCSVLNHMEALKSVPSPKMLFFTTYPTLYTVVETNGKVNDEDKLDEFASNIDKEVSEIPHFKWGDIDMMLVKMEKTKICDSPTAAFQRHWYG